MIEGLRTKPGKVIKLMSRKNSHGKVSIAMALCLLANFSPLSAIEGNGLTGRIEKLGEFDDSTELLARKFSRLRSGMSPSEVKDLFPKHVSWQLTAIDRHYAQEVGFQWQDEVFFIFSFRNTKPLVNGEVNRPKEMSSDWALAHAFVLRITTKVEDGDRIHVKRWKEPKIVWSPKSSKQEGAN